MSILAPDDKSDNGKQPWTLSLGDSHPAPLGQWRVQGTVIEYREADDRAWRQVGEVGGGASGAPLEIQLLPELPCHLLEPIVRGVSLSYSGSESMTVSAEFRLRWGADERSSVVWRPVWLMAKNGADEEAASAEAKASDEP